MVGFGFADFRGNSKRVNDNSSCEDQNVYLRSSAFSRSAKGEGGIYGFKSESYNQYKCRSAKGGEGIYGFVNE